jgi:hypothetical protein
MKVINAGIRSDRRLTRQPKRRRQPLPSVCEFWQRLDKNAFSDFIPFMARDENDIISPPLQRLALLVENADIERGMGRCNMADFTGKHLEGNRAPWSASDVVEFFPFCDIEQLPFRTKIHDR